MTVRSPSAPPPVVPWRRKLTFTRMGKWYVGITIGIGMAAINTGNNLLFLILGLLLASIVVSGILSERTLRGLSIERRLPASARAGDATLVGLLVRNQKRRSPSVSLKVSEIGGDVEGASFFLWIRARKSQEVAYHLVPRRRGLHRVSGLRVATRAPFGLFEKSRDLAAPAELLVYPRRVAPPPLSLRASARLGDTPVERAGHGQEVHGLREHRPGEDVRSIHWRTSARAGRLIGIDREEESRRRICVLLDHRGLEGDDLEAAVELAAALFERELAGGAEVAIAVAGRALEAGSGPVHLHAGLSLLALLECAPPGSAPPVAPSDAAVLQVPRTKMPRGREKAVA